MSKAKAAAEEPSIESLLDSIRRAIHDETDSNAPPAGDAAPRAAGRQAAASPGQPPATAPRPLKPRATPAPHLAESPRPAAPSSPRPLIAPLAPQLQGSLRDLKVSVQPVQAPGSAGTGRTEDLLALRSRIADLSATRERLARLSAGGPSSFASVLGGYVKPDEAMARSARRPAFEPQLPPPATARGIADREMDLRAPGSLSPIPPLDLPPFERTPGLREPFAEAEEGYIESPLPDPGAAEYAAEAWERDPHDDDDLPAGSAAVPALAGEPARDRTILSQEVADATATAFDRLADTIVSQASGGARSVEDITRDLLRPMLKAWLDANLQSVVERLVREEIDRVARRSGR